MRQRCHAMDGSLIFMQISHINLLKYDPMDITFIVTFNSYVSVITDGNGTLIQVFYSMINRSMARHLSCSPYRAEYLKSSST